MDLPPARAAQIIALGDSQLYEKLRADRIQAAQTVLEKNAKIKQQFNC